MTYNLARLKYTHERMIELIVARPTITAEQLAVEFDLTPAWIYRVRSSDAFKELLRERTREFTDPLLTATIDESFDFMVKRSLEIIADKLSKPSEEVPVDIAMQAAALGAKARGYGGFGAKQAPAATPRDPNWLQQSAERIRNLNSREGVIDVESREVPNVPQAGEAGAV